MTINTPHAPGPVARVQFFDADGYVVAEAIGKPAQTYRAAPDLLAALGDCLPDMEHYAATHGPGPDKRLAAVRAAIAKATGGDQ